MGRMKVYKVTYYDADCPVEIKDVEADRMTDKYVWIWYTLFDQPKLIKKALRSNNEAYFSTFNEAKEYLLSRLQKHIDATHAILNNYHKKVEKLENMTEPENKEDNDK